MSLHKLLETMGITVGELITLNSTQLEEKLSVLSTDERLQFKELINTKDELTKLIREYKMQEAQQAQETAAKSKELKLQKQHEKQTRTVDKEFAPSMNRHSRRKTAVEYRKWKNSQANAEISR